METETQKDMRDSQGETSEYRVTRSKQAEISIDFKRERQRQQ